MTADSHNLALGNFTYERSSCIIRSKCSAVPPESTVGKVEGVGFADVVTVSGVVCGLVVVEGGGDVIEVVVLGVVSKVNFRRFEVKFD